MTFTIFDKQDAVEFWIDGYDTLQIAEFYGVPESKIYKDLPKWRSAFKMLKAS